MKVALYVRVSTHRQVQAQTIDQQLDRLRAHVRTQGWELPEANVFRDDGYSGATLIRPGLDRLRDRVALREFDRVLVTDPDRLARNYVHQVLLIEELRQRGCSVEFLDRPMSQDPHDQLLLQIRGAVAEYERSLIAERMRRGRLMKYQAGILLPWTRPPYGYRVDPDHPRDPAGVRLEDAEAAVVADLFAAYLEEGGSLYGLVRRLLQRQVPTYTGRSCWHTATIRTLLTNPVYTGTVYVGRTRCRPAEGRRSPLTPISPHAKGSQPRTPPEEWTEVASIPPIVSQETFDRVQIKLSQNQKCSRRNNTAHEYLLRARISCGLCQGACMGRWVKGYAYYTCQRKQPSVCPLREERCPSRYFPAQRLDDCVWTDLCEIITQPERIAQALQRAQGGEWLPQELQARRGQIRKGQASLEGQLNRLTEAYLAGVIPLAEYQRRRADLEGRLEALAAQAQQLDGQVDRQAELAGWGASIETFCRRIQNGLAEATFEQKRQLVELLIDRVVVTEEEVEIRYVIPTHPSSETVPFCHLRKDYFSDVVFTAEVGDRLLPFLRLL